MWTSTNTTCLQLLLKIHPSDQLDPHMAVQTRLLINYHFAATRKLTATAEPTRKPVKGALNKAQLQLLLLHRNKLHSAKAHYASQSVNRTKTKIGAKNRCISTVN